MPDRITPRFLKARCQNAGMGIGQFPADSSSAYDLDRPKLFSCCYDPILFHELPLRGACSSNNKFVLEFAEKELGEHSLAEVILLWNL
jgi:hypothetical protein